MTNAGHFVLPEGNPSENKYMQPLRGQSEAN